MLAVLLPLSSMVVDEAVGLTDIASSAEDIFSSTVRGCSMCQRVAAMSPQQQVVFFTLVTATFATMLVVYLLYRVRAKMVPGIIFPREQLPWFGALLSVNKNFHRMSEWKRDVVTRTLEETRQKDMIAAMKRNATAEEVEASSKPREMYGWSIPGAAPLIDVLSPRNVHYLLHGNFSNFEKGYMFTDVFEEFLGHGIFVVDGEQWRQQRKTASFMFSHAKLTQYMYQTFAEDSARVIDYLHTVARSGKEIDFQATMFAFTFDAICKIAFGKEMHTIGASQLNPFCVAFDDIQSFCMARSMSPQPWWKLKRALNIGSERQFRKSIKLVDEFVNIVIQERKANLAEYEDSGDLLSLFLHEAQRRGETMSDRTTRDVILNFMLAGRDTTATALTWLFYYMSSHPEIEQQCADEVASALDSGVDASAEAIKSLTFLEATFMETTRLATPVPVDMKLCLQTCRFPSGEIIPAGTYVIYSPYLLGRLPSFYEGASGVVKTWAKDCEQFRPARWMTQDEDGQPKVLQPAPHEFPTFNVGPRLCLGKSMAILEGKTLAANILQTFRIKVRPGFEVTQRVAPVLAMLHGLPVTVEYRK